MNSMSNASRWLGVASAGRGMVADNRVRVYRDVPGRWVAVQFLTSTDGRWLGGGPRCISPSWRGAMDQAALVAAEPLP